MVGLGGLRGLVGAVGLGGAVDVDLVGSAGQ